MPPAESPALTNMLTDLSSRRRRNARRFEKKKKGKKASNGQRVRRSRVCEIRFRLELMGFAQLVS